MIRNFRNSILLSTAIILNSLLSFAQEPGKPAEKKAAAHNEAPDDPYLPNAYNNKKTSPGYKYTNAVESQSVKSSIFTTQVNVDPNGENIIGDAANEPSIAVNPLNPNIMIIGWRQFDNIASNFRQAGWAYTLDGGLGWTFAGTIEPGIFRSDPVLDYDMNGNFYYNSLTSISGVHHCKVFKSSDGGSSWNTGVDARGGDKQWMAIDHTEGPGKGSIYSAWSHFSSSCSPNIFTRSSDGGSSFENCSIVNSFPRWGTMVIGDKGELYVVGFSRFSFDKIAVAKSVNAQTAGSVIKWDTALVFMDGREGNFASVNPQGLLGQVDIDADGDNVYVLASLARISNPDSADVMFVKSTDRGLTWGTPVRVNDDISTSNFQWFGTMSVAPGGRIDVVWLDTRNAPPGSDSSALYYSYSTDQGNTWSVNEKLSGLFDPHVGYPNQNKLGDYFDMKSDSLGAHLAWAGTFNGEQDVYYSRIIPGIITAVTEIQSPAKVSVFPNPTSGAFFILNDAKPSRIEIFSLLGEKIYSLSDPSGRTVEINISVQPAGVYFLKVTAADGSAVVKKIIKE